MGILLLLVVFGAIFFYFGKKFAKKYTNDRLEGTQAVSVASFVLSIICGLALIGILAEIFVINVRKDVDIAKLQESWYVKQQMVTDILTDDRPYITPSERRKAYEVAEEWNSWLASKKKLHENPWVGVFYPIDYDVFDAILLPESYG